MSMNQSLHGGEYRQVTANAWDHQMNLWVRKGMPADDATFPKPGRHPIDNHQWNVNQEEYIRLLKIDKDRDKYKNPNTIDEY